MTPDRDWQAIFNESFRKSPTTVQQRVWREVFGDEYPEEVEPYSYVSRTELAQIRDELRVGPGDLLGDLGCGQGGPGLWLAAQTGANLIGVDISDVALAAATERATALGLTKQTRYQGGSFADTGLAAATLDAVVSIDALLFAPDKTAAVTELARILRPGGRLTLTTWDYHRQPKGRPPQVNDHRPLLGAAGFTVLSYADTDDWRRRIVEVGDRLVDAAEELAAESGEDVTTLRANLVEMQRTADDMIRRALIVAERKP
jgi:SAM-dependent methyltransferase